MSSIANSLVKYYADMPLNIPQKAAQSFLTTAAIAVLCGSTLSAGVIAGSVAVLATLVESVTRPIMNEVFGKEHIISRLFQACLTIGLVHRSGPRVVSHFGETLVINPVLSFLAWVALNGDRRENQAYASVVV